MKVSDYKSEQFVKKYQKRPIAHKYIVFPALLKILGSLQNKDILDVGCGGGDFSRIMASKGAKVTAVDQSRQWIKVCREENKDNEVRCLVMDGSNLKSLKSQSFDLIVMNMVLLNVSSATKIKAIFKEITRVLKVGGRLVFTDLNPISKMTPKTSTEKQIYKSGFSYFKNGSGYKSEVILEDYSNIKFDDIHWTLEFITTQASKNGLSLLRLVEPIPIKDSPKILNDYKIPDYLIFEYIKK